MIGSTDSQAAEAKDRPVHFQEFIATLYNRLGIDADRITLPDLAGRPHYLVDEHDPVRGLIGRDLDSSDAPLPLEFCYS